MKTLILAATSVLLLASCHEEPTASEVAGKYTEQTAQAIIECGWKISYAILIAAIIRGFMNK